MKKVNIDNLPKKKYSDGYRIDWNKCNNKLIEFQYEDITGLITIVKASSSNKIVEIEYNGTYSEIDKHSLMSGKIGRIIGKVAKRGVVAGLNDISTTDPWMIAYFQGGVKEARLYSACSGKFIIPICPDCGQIKNKEIRISDIKKMHGIACTCNDRFSYPEKVMYILLEHLKIPFVHHFKPNWANGIALNGERQRYEYDFKIEKNELIPECIVEMQGSQHFQNHGFAWCGGRSFEEEQFNDNQKKKCAYDHGYSENSYFQIDCKKSTFDYIISNILSSKIAKNIHLGELDMDTIRSKTFDNLNKKVCDFYNKHQSMTAYEIAEHFHIGDWTALRYLKNGTSVGWCSYDPKRKIKSGQRKHAKTIYVYSDDGVYVAEVPGIIYLERNSKVLLNCTLNNAAILQVLRHERFSYKNYIFTYEKDVIHKKENCGTVKRQNCKVYCLDKDMKIIETYFSPLDAERKTGINHSQICRCCKTKYTTAKGFLWMYADEFDSNMVNSAS